MRRLQGKGKIIKRAVDVAAAGTGLLVLSPALLATACLLRTSVGSPVLFRQKRPGKNGEPFELVKFRTMTEARDERGRLLPDSDRLTSIGRLVRTTSLDELPQLWNVLKGEMSLVGPRPLLMQYLNRYTPEQARRHEVQPGITGWAQVNGRNALSWEEKFRLDVWYVDHWSLWLDAKILLATLRKVLARKDISQQGQATAEEFQGGDASLNPFPCHGSDRGPITLGRVAINLATERGTSPRTLTRMGRFTSKRNRGMGTPSRTPLTACSPPRLV